MEAILVIVSNEYPNFSEQDQLCAGIEVIAHVINTLNAVDDGMFYIELEGEAEKLADLRNLVSIMRVEHPNAKFKLFILEE